MRTLKVSLAVLLLPAVCFAAGYAVPNTNPRDDAMAGANVANETGPEAAYGNIAAIAGREGLGISASGSVIYFRSTWTDTSGLNGPSATADQVPKAAFPPNFNVTYGGKLSNGMGWGVGAAFAAPGGGLVHWPRNWAGQYYIQEVNRQIVSLDVGGAFQPIESLKLGVTGTYIHGSEQLFQMLNFVGQQGEAHLSTNGSGWSWTAAAEFTPSKDLPLRFGAQYKHQGLVSLSGNAHFIGVPQAFQTSGLIDQGATHNTMFPNVLNLGASYDPIPNLTVNIAYTFWRWVVYRNDVFVGDKGLTIDIAHNFHNGQTYRLGAEYGGIAALPALKVRAGFLRDVSPQPSDTLSPALPDASRWVMELGAGYSLLKDTLDLNVAWEHAFFDSTTATGTETLNGTYDITADVFVVGLAYKMK